MNDFPLPGIIEFLKNVVPFNTLDTTALQEVVAATLVAFYPADDQLNLLSRDNQLQVDMFMTGEKVRSLMSTNLLTCDRQTTVQQAAGLMKQHGVGAIVVMDNDGSPAGILTDADLRSKIIAEGRDLDTAVSLIMSTPIRTVSPRAYTFDALLDMSRFGVSPLVVTQKKQAVGIVSEHDFQLAIGSSPIGMIGDITKATTVSDLVDKRVHIDRVLEKDNIVSPFVR